MALTKKFSFLLSASGLTIYAVVIQRDTGYYLSDVDGTFVADPVDKYQEVSEDAALTGRYIYNESRTAWVDGPYEILCYQQLGVSPNPLTDTPVAVGGFNLVGDSTQPVTSPVSGSYTLAQLVSKWRQRLDDTVLPYLWSNDDLTDYADGLQKMVCADLGTIEDRTTAAVCSVALVQGSGLVSVSSRIIRIKQAYIDGEDTTLDMLTAAEMDVLYGPGWDAATVAQDTPTTLVTYGVGQNKVYLYPPLDAVAGGTLKLVVLRFPLVDLDYTTHSTWALEIDRFAHLLTNGIMWQAYLKQDSDAYDPKKAERHRGLWEDDLETMRRTLLKERLRPEMCVPHPGSI